MSDVEPVKWDGAWYLPVDQRELTAMLLAMAARVNLGDSFEGSIQYLMADPDIHPEPFLVRASYRVDNLQGQGSVRLVPNPIQIKRREAQ